MIDDWRDIAQLSTRFNAIQPFLQVHIMDLSVGPVPDDERLATGTQSIERAVAILRLLGSNPRNGAGLSQLVDESGLIKSTCRRILLALISAGLAEQDPVSRRYFLGPEAYVLGTIAAERYGIHRLSLESVTRLAALTGDAAFIQVRRGFSVVCLHREDGTYPIRSHVLTTGDRHPMGAGAGPLAILAALPDAEVERALAANMDDMTRKYPGLSRGLILDLVAETRAQGYSLNRGLIFPGSWGMAMVVRDGQGRPEACLSLAAIESRMQPDRQPQLAAWLAEEVRRIEPRLSELKTAYENDIGNGAAAKYSPRLAATGR
jgi:DNA-binding IclR family transcriptional regulator